MASTKSQSKWAQGERPTIGFLTHGIDAFGQVLWQGAADAAQEGGASLVCVAGGTPGIDIEGAPGQANVLYDVLGTESLDGVVISGILGNVLGREEFLDFCRRFRPLPVVGTVLGEALDGFPSVVVDNRPGMRGVITHLIEAHGRRRIAFIRGIAGEFDAEERYRVYTEVLAEHGIDLDPTLVVRGDNSGSSGAAAVRDLLDGRGAAFDALVVSNDNMALRAQAVLQERGIRVPAEVSVTGFDDIEESALVTPPLTTVRYPRYESGQRAVEMVLALLAGEEAPEEVRLAAPPVVRRSCGCALAPVTEAAAEPASNAARGFARAFARRREGIVAAVAEAAGAEPGQAEALVDGFAVDVRDGGAAGGLLAALEEALDGSSPRSGAAWQGAISALRRGALPCLGDEATRVRAEDLLQQARVAAGEAARRAEGLATLQAAGRAEAVRGMGASLITTFDVEELMDVLVEGLPQVGIPGTYLVLYEDPDQPAATSRLVLAYDERGRLEAEFGEGPFPSKQLVPRGVLPQDRQVSLVVKPLFFREHQLGLALFEAGPQDGEVYEALRGQVSSALEGALLLQDRARAEAALQEAYAQVEQQVAERTAELEKEVAERGRAQAENLRLQQEVIDAQRRAIQELSTPIIPVAERVLVMPLIGSIDSLRARDVTRRLLAGIREHRAKVVILDVTGVPMIDSGIAAHLNRTIQAARLKGARTIVTGLSDAVAETIVDLGIDWSRVETLADLQTGLRVVMATS